MNPSSMQELASSSMLKKMPASSGVSDMTMTPGRDTAANAVETHPTGSTRRTAETRNAYGHEDEDQHTDVTPLPTQPAQNNETREEKHITRGKERGMKASFETLVADLRGTNNFSYVEPSVETYTKTAAPRLQHEVDGHAIPAPRSPHEIDGQPQHGTPTSRNPDINPTETGTKIPAPRSQHEVDGHETPAPRSQHEIDGHPQHGTPTSWNPDINFNMMKAAAKLHLSTEQTADIERLIQALGIPHRSTAPDGRCGTRAVAAIAFSNERFAIGRDATSLQLLERLRTAAARIVYEVYKLSGEEIQTQITEKIIMDGMEKHKAMDKWFRQHEHPNLDASVGRPRWTDELILLGLSWLLNSRIEYHQVENLCIGPAVPIHLPGLPIDYRLTKISVMWHLQKSGVGAHIEGMQKETGTEEIRLVQVGTAEEWKSAVQDTIMEVVNKLRQSGNDTREPDRDQHEQSKKAGKDDWVEIKSRGKRHQGAGGKQNKPTVRSNRFNILFTDDDGAEEEDVTGSATDTVEEAEENSREDSKNEVGTQDRDTVEIRQPDEEDDGDEENDIIIPDSNTDIEAEKNTREANGEQGGTAHRPSQVQSEGPEASQNGTAVGGEQRGMRQQTPVEGKTAPREQQVGKKVNTEGAKEREEQHNNLLDGRPQLRDEGGEDGLEGGQWSTATTSGRTGRTTDGSGAEDCTGTAGRSRTEAEM